MLQILPSGSLTSIASAQTLTARIKQEKKRLEAVVLIVKTASAVTTGVVEDGPPGLVKEIRLRVNDVLGQRNAVKVSGPGLLSFLRNNFGFLDRNTFQAYQTLHVASTVWTFCFYIPLRHPMFAEPYGNLLSLPLSAAFVKDDPILEVDLCAGAEVWAGTLPASATVRAMAILRDIPDSVPYIPSELITDTLNADSAAAKKTFEFPSVGFLTQVLAQGYSAQTYAATVDRASLLTTTTGLLTLEVGRNKIRTFDDDSVNALNDLSQLQMKAVSGDIMSNRSFLGEYFIDLLSDHPGSDAFSAASVINLNTDALGGDKCRLIFDTMPLNVQARITYHKLLARTPEAIKPLMVNV